MTFFGYTIASAASIAISLIGFIIGMRVAKERADRGILRGLYQELFVHFRSIKDSAERGRPKDWADFKLVGNRFMPVVVSLVADGRISMLPKRLATEMLSVEHNVLMAGGQFKKIVAEKLGPAVTNAVTAVVTQPFVGVSGKSFGSYQIGQLALGEKISRDRLMGEAGKEIGVGIELSLSAGQSRQLQIFEETLQSGSVSDLLSTIDQVISDHDEAQKAATTLRSAVGRVDLLLKRLARRIKDPNPFFETIFEAVPDLFRR
jgi:hypothetical protein